MQKPLLYPAITLACGILAGSLFVIPALPLLLALVVCLFALLWALKTGFSPGILTVTMAVTTIIGILNINLYLYSAPEPHHIVNYLNKGKMVIEGIISAPPQESPEGEVLIVEARSLTTSDGAIVPLTGRIMINARFNTLRHYGDLIRFRTRLRLPRNFNNSGGFDYVRQLRAQGILVRGSVNNISDLTLIRAGFGNSFQTAIEELRSKLRQVIVENSRPPEGQIIQALLLGEKKQLPSSIREDFNRTGTSHVLAISGLHVGMVASFTIVICLLVMKSHPYLLLRLNAIRLSTCLALIPVLIYALLAGMSVSVVRATIMLCAFMSAILLRRGTDLMNTLALAALIILLVSPYELFDVSFQLSFAAVASLILIAPLLSRLWVSNERAAKFMAISYPRRALRGIILFFCASLAATLGTLPIIAYYFNGISTISLPANGIIVPLMGLVALALGMAVIITLPFSPALAGLFVKLCSLPIKLSLFIIGWLASLPGSYFRITTPSIAEIAGYYLLLFILFRIIGKKREEGEASSLKTSVALKLTLASLILFFIVDYAYRAVMVHSRRDLTITAIDVGQGSATLLQLPRGTDVLVDGGGSLMGHDGFDIGRYVVAPFLWHQRISKLDLVILTHSHPDHLQGLLYILKNFDVREVWVGGYQSENVEYSNFIDIINDKKIPLRIVDSSPGVRDMNGVLLTVLNNKQSASQHGNNNDLFQTVNDSSLVIRLVYGKTSFLLPGDISRTAEDGIRASGADLSSDVLFVPHHGGFTSSSPAFLQAVKPRIAIVSCGFENMFNLPHPDVLKRYAALPAKVYRTDLDGAVTLTTDGRNLSINTLLTHPAVPEIRRN